MFKIEGTARFTKSDMCVGEKLAETLINEGFGVGKDYIFSPEPMLVLKFGSERRDDVKDGALFSID